MQVLASVRLHTSLPLSLLPFMCLLLSSCSHCKYYIWPFLLFGSLAPDYGPRQGPAYRTSEEMQLLKTVLQDSINLLEQVCLSLQHAWFKAGLDSQFGHVCCFSQSWRFCAPLQLIEQNVGTQHLVFIGLGLVIAPDWAPNELNKLWTRYCSLRHKCSLHESAFKCVTPSLFVSLA